MKCGACGYEYIKETKIVDKVTYYKSGKRRGQVKVLGKKEVVFEVGYAPFTEIRPENVTDRFVTCSCDRRPVGFFVCPECETLKAELQ